MAATPKSKESAYWKNKEREELGGFDHEFFYHHTLFVGYNVTNVLYSARNAGEGIRGLAPRKALKCTSDSAGKCPFTRTPGERCK